MSQSQPQSGSRSGRNSARSDGERSRQRILDAAEELLSDRGYAGTGIAAISDASGLPASSIYWHFANKEDLVASAVERATDRWIAALEAIEPGPGASAEELLAWMARSTEEMGRRLPFFMRISLLLALELGHREPELLARLRRGRDRARALVQRTLERLLTTDGTSVPPEITQEVAHLTLAFSEGAFVARIYEPDAIDPARLSEDLEVAMRAITEQRRMEASS